VSWKFAVVQEILQIDVFSFYGCCVRSPLLTGVVVKLSSIVVGLAPHGLSDRYDHNTGREQAALERVMPLFPLVPESLRLGTFNIRT
jgi:hypothetical protein